MKRKEGWEKIFNDHVEEHRELKREWGKNDCCLSIVSWILKATGVDTSLSFNWSYKTKKEAYELLSKYAGGFDQAIDKLTKEFEMPECPVLMAGRGDIGIASGNGGNALGIVGPTGRHLLIQGKEGWDEVPMKSVIKTWRVG